MKYKILIAFLFMVGIFAGAFFYWWQNSGKNGKNILQVVRQKSPSFGTLKFNLSEAPKLSVRGNVASVSGHIFWQSRVATEPAALIKPIKIQQGEKLIASESGKITVSYENAGMVNLSPDSKLNIIQTLPENFVFEQEKGTVSYQSVGQTNFSVRVHKLLTTIKNGMMEITISEDGNTVTCSIKNGRAYFAYNDKDFVSHTLALKIGQKFIFDNVEREGTVE